jgi:intergrase/recombinase
VPPAGFESAIPVSERPQTYALDSAATGIGLRKNYFEQMERSTKLCGLKSVTDFLVNRRFDSNNMDKYEDSLLILQQCFTFRGYIRDNEMEKLLQMVSKQQKSGNRDQDICMGRLRKIEINSSPA